MIPVRSRIWATIRCRFGFHLWHDMSWITKYGGRFGKHCLNCGIWHKSSVIAAADKEGDK